MVIAGPSDIARILKNPYQLRFFIDSHVEKDRHLLNEYTLVKILFKIISISIVISLAWF
jgi:hypothetical protein